MPTTLQSQTATTESPRNRQKGLRGEQSRTGWFWAVAPLWPLGLTRILYGYLWWQQSGWKVPSDDFGRKSGGGLWYWVQQQSSIPPPLPARRLSAGARGLGHRSSVLSEEAEASERSAGQ